MRLGFSFLRLRICPANVDDDIAYYSSPRDLVPGSPSVFMIRMTSLPGFRQHPPSLQTQLHLKVNSCMVRSDHGRTWDPEAPGHRLHPLASLRRFANL
jgi:hypothetical protein